LLAGLNIARCKHFYDDGVATAGCTGVRVKARLLRRSASVA
jgi:hypothetical protein